MRKVLRTMDSISGYTGGLLKWLCYALVLVIVIDVVARYVFKASTVWAYDLSYMLGAAIYSLAWTYTQRYREHVRVDVVYARLSPRKKAIIDTLGNIFVFLPLVAFLTVESSRWAWKAWLIKEKLVETYWYPPAAPIRTVVALAFFLLFFQLIADLVRQGYFAIKGAAYD